METTIRIADRLRRLNDGEFNALRRMVEAGDEPSDESVLAVVCEALADCTEMVEIEGRTARDRRVTRA